MGLVCSSAIRWCMTLGKAFTSLVSSSKTLGWGADFIITILKCHQSSLLLKNKYKIVFKILL